MTSVAREVKELSPPAGVWLGRPHVEAPRPTAGPSWAPDPVLLVRGNWQGRRLAPDCVKLALADYGHGEERHLVHAMGFETANVHQRSPEPAVDAVRKHATTLDEAHFRHAVEQLADQVASDRHVWHSHQALAQQWNVPVSDWPVTVLPRTVPRERSPLSVADA